MKRALIIRHSTHETLATNFTRTLEELEFQLELLNLFESAPLYDRFSPPGLSETNLILVLGGSISANDPYPALAAEKSYLKDALEGGTPVFGVCLGAQMMSVALGGSVEPTGGYQCGLRKLYVTAEGHADPVFSKLTVPLVPDPPRRVFLNPRRSHQAGRGLYAAT